MKPGKLPRIGLTMFLLLCGGFLGFQIMKWLSPPPPRGPLVDVAGVEQLDSISEFIEPMNEEECTQLAASIRSKLDRDASDSGVRDGRKHELLMALVEKRVNLILNPDYDEYVRHVGDLVGVDGHSAVGGSMFEDRALWENFARTYRFAALVPQQTILSGPTEFPCGRRSSGGRRITMSDPGYYGSQRLADNGGDVQIVVLPMLLAPLGGDPPRMFTVFVSLSFVWDAARERWIPLETCVQDPTGANEGVPTLWI